LREAVTKAKAELHGRSLEEELHSILVAAAKPSLEERLVLQRLEEDPAIEV
jgi:plasmid stability protein